MNVLFAGLVFVAAAPGLKDPPAKPATIEGEWTVESSLLGGQDDGLMTKSPIDKIVITADRWTVVRNGMQSHGSAIAVDVKQNPPHLNIGMDNMGGGCKAIFQLDGDKLSVCYVLTGERPTKIESPPNTQLRLMTLKRLKK